MRVEFKRVILEKERLVMDTCSKLRRLSKGRVKGSDDESGSCTETLDMLKELLQAVDGLELAIKITGDVEM